MGMTQAYIDKWRTKSGKLARLAIVELPRADGTQTDLLYCADQDCYTPANTANGDPSRAWHDVIAGIGPVRQATSPGSTDLPLATGSIVFHPDRLVMFPAGIGAALNITLRDSVTIHVWAAAKITLLRFFLDMDDFADAATILYQAGITDIGIDDKGLSLALRQMVPWNVPLSPRTVGRNEFPRAPDGAVGAPLGIDYGRHDARKLRAPWPIGYFPAGFRFYEALRNGDSKNSRAAMAVLVDTGRGGGVTQNNDMRVGVAGHQLAACYPNGSEDGGTGVYLDFEGALGKVFDVGSGVRPNAINNSQFAGVGMPDGFKTFLVGLPPKDIAAVANTATEARNILNPSDTLFATMDYAAGARVLQMTFPGLPEKALLESISQWWIVVGHQSAPSSAGIYVSAYMRDFYAGGTYYWFYNQFTGPDWVLSGSSTPQIQAFGPISTNQVDPHFNLPWSPDWFQVKLQYGPANPGTTWQPNGAGGPWDVGGHGLVAGAGTAHIFFVGVVVQIGVKKFLLESERVFPNAIVRDREARPQGNSKGGSGGKRPAMGPFPTMTVVPPIYELRGDFYANMIGRADDGAGTFTGSAGSVIERAPDIMMHLLNVYGGVSLNDIERGASSFGSFVAARASLKYGGNDPAHALAVTEATDVLTPILWLAADSLTMPNVSPIDGKVKLHVWKPDPPLTYPRLLFKEDVEDTLGPDINPTSKVDVITDLRIAYNYDGKARTYREDMVLGPDRSSSGYETRGLRDQQMECLAGVNDRLDYRSNNSFNGAMTTRVAVITPRKYLPMSSRTISQTSPADYEEGLAQHVKAQMAWGDGTQASGSRYQVGWGTKITQTYNDQLAFKRNGVAATVVLPPNDGSLTCEQLAAAVQAAVRAQYTLSNFVCTYSRATNLFSISVNEAGVTWLLRATGGGEDYTFNYMQHTAWALLGFYMAGADTGIGTSPREGDDLRLEERFYIMNIGGSSGTPGPKIEFELLFKSGANGPDSGSDRSAATLLGYTPGLDRLKDYTPCGFAWSYLGDCAKGDYEAKMNDSATLYGRRRETGLQARTIRTDLPALSLRRRLADLFREPRNLISFSSRAMPDAELGHVFGFAEEMVRPYACPGSDGLWVGKKFMAIDVANDSGPTTLSTRITAIDLSTLATIVVAIGLAVTLGGVAMRIA